MRCLFVVLALFGSISVISAAYAGPGRGATQGEHNGASHTNCGEDSTVGQGKNC